MEEDLM